MDIRKLRERRNLSQSALAKMVQVSPAYVSHWECGRRSNLSPRVINQLVSALDCTEEEANHIKSLIGSPLP